MRDSDVRVLDASVDFREIKLHHPLVISGGSIDWFTMAVVRLRAVDRGGRSASGAGASVLSIPWAWPSSAAEVTDRDEVLRRVTSELADGLLALGETDPIQAWHALSAQLPAACAGAAGSVGVDEPVPHLAGALALGAVDNALHDVWARAAGRSAFTMYDRAFLNDDLGAVFGPEFAGAYPADFLTPPVTRLPVQHLVGAADPLTSAESHDGSRSLDDWLRSDGISHVKVKVMGADSAGDAQRIVDVHQSAVTAGNGTPQLALDPNEAYVDIGMLGELLKRVGELSPTALEAIRYVEQPIPRGASPDPAELRAVSRRVPVVMDEGLISPEQLPTLDARGWSGVVIKAGKGQTPALLANSFAQVRGLFTTVQDLTATDLALVHSARLVSMFDLSVRHLECNSRQYAPDANASLAEVRPELVNVRDGFVRIDAPSAPGLC